MLCTKLWFAPAKRGFVPARFFNPLLLCLELLLTLCFTVPVLAADPEYIEYDPIHGIIPGVSGAPGIYANLWHNTPESFSYWGNTVAPDGDYIINWWNGPSRHQLSDCFNSNTIIIESDLVTGCVLGAINDRDDVTDAMMNNRVIISNNTVQVGDTPGYTYVEAFSGIVLGALNSRGEVIENCVEIHGGTILQRVCGGQSNGNNAIGNSVIITGGVVRNVKLSNVDILSKDWWYELDIDGNPTTVPLGSSERDALQLHLERNTELDPDGITVLQSNVFGGHSGNGNAHQNSVTITDTSVGDYVYGGYCSGGAATENSVNISGTSEVGQVVYGGWTRGTDAIANKVTINGDTVIGSKTNGWGGKVYGGYSDMTGGTVKSNEVTLSGNVQVRATTTSWGLFGGNVCGGYVDLGRASVIDNKVTISGNVVIDSDVAGGYIYEWGNGNITGNSVILSGGAIGGSVYGGYTTGDGTVNSNSITLSGGTILGNIYTGHGFGITADNTLTIRGNPTFGTTTKFYGGDGSTSSGNTFNLYSTSTPIRVAGLEKFQIMNFYLPTTAVDGDVMVYANDYADVTDATVNVGIYGASSPLRQGDHIVLIETANLIGEPDNATSGGQGMYGVTLHYEFDIETHREFVDHDELWAILKKATVNQQMEDLSKGYLAGMSLLNQGGDLVSWYGMSGVVRAAREARYRGYGIFFDMSGGWSRYHTGCHVDLSGLSLITGVAKYRNLQPGHLTLGTFIEYGNGTYNTYNTFTNAAPVHGKGNLHYLGGGVLSRMEFNSFGSGHFYTEASFRVGGLSNGYHNADICDFWGQSVSYDSRSAYYGMHIGIGKSWHLSNRTIFDLYTKYLWTGLQKDSVTLSTGDPVDFQTVNSNHLRLGGRWTGGAVAATLKPYCGAAWEHEFSGAARATTNGYAIDVPSLRGDTGIGELGFSWKPVKYHNIHTDLSVQGYIGKREGGAVNLLVEWKR